MNFYNMQGKPISIEEYAGLFIPDENGKNKRCVGYTEGRFFAISTVLLGVDHSFEMSNPIIFETMVFTKDRYNIGVHCVRYPTLAKAKGGHLQVVEHFTGWRGFKKWVAYKIGREVA